MTDHADISRRLALAIGWDEGRVAVRGGTTVWCLEKRDGIGHGWRPFDYRDPVIAWRVAEHFDRFPQMNSGTHWFVTVGIKFFYGDTAAEAVARAVIGGAG